MANRTLSIRSQELLHKVNDLEVQIGGFEEYLREIENRLGTPIGNQMRQSQKDALIEFQYRMERLQMDKIDSILVSELNSGKQYIKEQRRGLNKKVDDMLNRVEIAKRCIDAGCTLDQLRRRGSFSGGGSDSGRTAVATTGGSPLARSETSIGVPFMSEPVPAFHEQNVETDVVMEVGDHDDIDKISSPTKRSKQGDTDNDHVAVNLQVSHMVQAMEKESCSLVEDPLLLKEMVSIERYDSHEMDKTMREILADLDTPYPQSPNTAPLGNKVQEGNRAVYSWGQGCRGQLLLGRDSTRDHFFPRVAEKPSKLAKQIACGRDHAAYVSQSGQVRVAGTNTDGCLSKDIPGECLHSPVLLEDLAHHTVRQMDCGDDFSACVTSNGQVFTFGSNENGRLGHHGAKPGYWGPKLVQGLARQRILEVSCGMSHTLCLTENAQALSFGYNRNGCLGLGAASPTTVLEPVLIEAIQFIPVRRVVAAGNQGFATTVNGFVYSWGGNEHGQLGLGSKSPQQTFPCKVSGLEDAVVTMDAGNKHTAFLLQNGEIHCCGDGSHGQTGLGSTTDALLPTMALKGKDAGQLVDVKCGAKHTLALSSGGIVWSCGSGKSGQLGTGEVDDKFRFVRVDKLKDVHAIFAGADCSFAISAPGVVSTTEQWPLVGFGTRQTLTEQLQKAKFQANHRPLLDSLQEIFSSVSVLNHSFLREDTVSSSSQLSKPSLFTIQQSSGLNVIEAETVFQEMLKLDPVQVASTLLACFNKTLDYFLANVEGNRLGYYNDPECFRFLLLVWQCPINTLNLSRNFIILKIAKCFALMPASVRDQAATWIRIDYPTKIFDLRLLQSVHRQLDVLHRVSHSSEAFSDPNTLVVIDLLEMLYHSSKNRSKSVGDISIDKFYTPVLDTLSDESLIKHLQNFQPSSYRNPRLPPQQSSSKALSILDYPFILSPVVKQRMVHLSSVYKKMVQMQNPSANVFGVPMQQSHPADKFFIMSVRREYLLQDTLRTIIHTPPDMLLKPMKVTFQGEDGVDEGGLLKEFFQLLTLQLFDLNYGMFIQKRETRVLWFNKNSWTSAEEFHLVGVLVGLAMYNGVILDLHFPAVVYKKMIGLKLSLVDLAELDPQLAKSLQQLLDFEDADAVQETFCQDFEITSEYLGEVEHVELISGGRNIPVTGENRKLYVDKYVDWYLSASVQKQFDPFKAGFMHTQDPMLVKLFHPSELQLLVAGTQRLNFHELEKNCSYADGFHREHPTMIKFWKVVHGMSFEQKCQLLKFTTGCKKAPIGGLAKLPFTIARLSPDSDQLPISHTCFNQLIMPEYSSKEKIAQKLEIAIKECEGFGLK